MAQDFGIREDHIAAGSVTFGNADPLTSSHALSISSNSYIWSGDYNIDLYRATEMQRNIEEERLMKIQAQKLKTFSNPPKGLHERSIII